jgi:hypothetical protein
MGRGNSYDRKNKRRRGNGFFFYGHFFWLSDGGEEMSGGSYDYLCCKNIGDLLYEEEKIQNMADRLAKLGYASDAVKETLKILLTLRQFKNQIDTMKDRLSVVWKAVEWWDSGDSGEDEVKKALEEYRKGFKNSLCEE